jgi:RNA-binding protein
VAYTAAVPLSPKQRRHLRALGHHLTAIVQIGKDGVSAGVVTALDGALVTHELVTVRIGRGCALDKRDAARELATETDSEVAQILGNTVLLYRRHPDEPRIFVD